MSVTLAPITNPQVPFESGDNSQKIRRVYFSVIPTNNYPGAPGDPLDFTTLGDRIHSSYPPIIVVLLSSKPGGVSGYGYSYVPANPATQQGFFQVTQSGAINSPEADIGAGAYPAGVLADNIIGYADFIRL